MWRQIMEQPRFCIGAYTAMFVLIWLIGWACNAVYSTHFDLDRLKDIYIWIMSQLNATHAINSIWNSPRGIDPGDNDNKAGCSIKL
ncbi:hypothetical protein [Dendrosporobacter sp. 1207_IL3150]|uniref:hypothetical protein n=1 Tax=Dendrosporobacter sp. 1207_IL3150 TaxID=3084054 RepID=UPI002FD8F14D